MNSILRTLPALFALSGLLSLNQTSLAVETTAAAPAAAPFPMARWQEGTHYERLSEPLPPAPAGRATVIEFFSYACVHCNRFEPIVDAWRKSHRKDVDLLLVPATFRPDFAMFARGYYASAALGVSEKIHQAVFDAVWKKQMPAGNIGLMADIYASVGVDRAKFIDACAAPEIEAKLKSAGELLEQAKVAGTPDLVVAGKYRVLLSGLTNAADAFKVVDYLLALELPPTPKPAALPRATAPKRKALAAARH